MTRPDDRVVLTTKGAELLRQASAADPAQRFDDMVERAKRRMVRRWLQPAFEALDLISRPEKLSGETQFDEVAAARDRAERRKLREARERMNLDDWNAGAVEDPWAERLAQRHRFGRETKPDDSQTSAPMPLWPMVTVAILAGLAILAWLGVLAMQVFV